MKKTMSLLLAFLLMMTLFVACGQDETTTEDTTAEGTESDTEEVDVVTTASLVDNGQAVVDGLSAEGTWIVATLNDTETDQDIIVEGLFYNRDDESSDIYRKLGLYTQDADRNILEQFTLTAPKMVVRSENFKIQGGTFIGDVYVEANGFTVGEEAAVDGNIYFASQEYMDTFVVDETAEVTGTQEVAGEVDVVTTASLVDNGQAVVDGLSADGTWIVATLNDTETDQDIIVEGLFYNRDDESSDIYRKLGLYTQDADRNILEQFTLTAPKMVVRSENFKIQGGTFIGDVYVEANGFTVGAEAAVDGNIYFASQEYMDTFVVDETAEVTGTQEVQ
jgi:hypothetical protein